MAAFATAMIMIGVDRGYVLFVVTGGLVLLGALALAQALARRPTAIHLPAPDPVDEAYLLRFFACSGRDDVAQPFADLAQVVSGLPANPERSVALRKLLEARDAALRAAKFKEGDE